MNTKSPLAGFSLILGGAASGKSVWAEEIAEAEAPTRLYIASARVTDAEMQEKITRHQARRGAGWRTIEAPRDVAGALIAARPGEVVLFDCASLWLTNLLLEEADIAAETKRLIDAIASCAAPVIVVSNETGCGIVPENALARKFRQEQGELNQRLARKAELAVLIAAGLPLVLKGVLP